MFNEDDIQIIDDDLSNKKHGGLQTLSNCGGWRNMGKGISLQIAVRHSEGIGEHNRGDNCRNNSAYAPSPRHE